MQTERNGWFCRLRTLFGRFHLFRRFDPDGPDIVGPRKAGPVGAVAHDWYNAPARKRGWPITWFSPSKGDQYRSECRSPMMSQAPALRRSINFRCLGTPWPGE